MIAWLGMALPVAALIAMIVVLGGPIAWALRARGFSYALIAVPAAFAVIALTSLAGPFVGLGWSLLLPFGLTVVLTLMIVALRRFVAIRVPASPNRRHGFLVPIASAAIGGLVIALSVAVAMKTPDAISQTYDVNFHLNAVRHILDTGNSSPLAMDISAPGASVFYPTLWHATVALIVQLTGVSIPLATNAALFTTVAVIWTIGMVGFGRAVAGPSARVTIISGILSVAIPVYPLGLTGYGILYPNLLSIALIPYCLVGFMQLFSIAQARRSDANSVGSAVLLALGSFGAVVLAHPNGTHSVLVWLIAPTVYLVVRALRAQPVLNTTGELVPSTVPAPLRKIVAWLALPGLAVVMAGAWIVGRTSDAPWGGNYGPRRGLLEALGMTPHTPGHSWPLLILVIIGCIAVFRWKKSRWLLLSGLVFFVLYYISDAFPPSAWRSLFLNPWYNTPWRIAALAWMGLFPLFVLGASYAWSMLRGGGIRWARLTSNPQRIRAFIATLAALFLLAATQGAGTHAGIAFVKDSYRAKVDSAPLLDEDERAILERLDQHLPDDAIIIDNPWNGGALAYAVSGFPVLTPHTGGSYDPRISELTAELKDGTPRACELVNELDARYILDFGTRYVFKETTAAEPFIGVTDVDGSDMFTELDREGDAVLYEVTGCDTTP